MGSCGSSVSNKVLRSSKSFQGCDATVTKQARKLGMNKAIESYVNSVPYLLKVYGEFVEAASYKLGFQVKSAARVRSSIG